MIASLPMYDWPELHPAHDRLWTAISAFLSRAGIQAPLTLARDVEGLEHWLRGDLLVSQTCGYPLATQLGRKVQVLGVPTYNVDGCGQGVYSSAIIVRADDPAKSFKDLLGRSFAFNGTNSLSGYRCLVPKLLKLGLSGDVRRAFERSVCSGAHRESARMVARGEADCAAIDALSWAHFCRFEEGAAALLRVLEWSDVFPALPLITSLQTDEATKSCLFDAFEFVLASNNNDLDALNWSCIHQTSLGAYYSVGNL